jgi:hypothetical protein
MITFQTGSQAKRAQPRKNPEKKARRAHACHNEPDSMLGVSGHEHDYGDSGGNF